MTQSQRRVLGVVLQAFGVLLVLIFVAALVGWTPRLVHPFLIVILAIAAVFGGGNMYRNTNQSDT